MRRVGFYVTNVQHGYNHRNMDYSDFPDQELKPPRRNLHRPAVIDLFAGRGGLALGSEAAGFDTCGREMLEDACSTYHDNLHGHCTQPYLKPGINLGVKKVDAVVGGPPCQPFSVGGLQNGKKDSRVGFPVFIEVVERHYPDILIIESVTGVLYRNQDLNREIG